MSKQLVAFYANTNTFSGQRFALELVVNGLIDKGWSVEVIEVPADDGANKFNLITRVIKLLPGLLISWIKVLILSKNKILYVGMGQTKVSLIREGFPLLIRRLLNYKELAVVPLHGSNFMKWKYTSWEAKLLRWISLVIKYITVLGPKQKQKMLELGLPEPKIIIMDNTCSLPPVSEKDILQKQIDKKCFNPVKPIKVLYLSSLIEQKGYVDFVEAINYLSEHSNILIEAVLCGKIIISKSDIKQFSTPQDVSDWLQNKINTINQSPSIRINWIDGAIGKEKNLLFQESQIFVLPTRYQTEAQPIAILEALASGSSVITTKVGEIPTTLSDETALFLDDYSSTAIAKAIEELSQDPEKRTKLAIKGLQLFQERFSYTSHIDKWEKLLNNFFI